MQEGMEDADSENKDAQSAPVAPLLKLTKFAANPFVEFEDVQLGAEKSMEFVVDNAETSKSQVSCCCCCFFFGQFLKRLKLILLHFSI
jgi:hypothetical protein